VVGSSLIHPILKGYYLWSIHNEKIQDITADFLKGITTNYKNLTKEEASFMLGPTFFSLSPLHPSL
jgi:hypothetical protein